MSSYELHLERAEIDDLVTAVLVHALDGYVDAGSGVSWPSRNCWQLPHAPWSRRSTSTG